ncbi:DUF5683 domain-containing protein [Pontibacter sp. G13]|uniref:DUF5683 domain-containing protein n=1 Tax=Pontibacter sp. G13 TaxID=3074898 RepID=UPI00288C0C40|nr:DUF5683 domain-containing protein [Pontibacter sp. G13]WNJ19869.1 DUF5683 domain-containing protein [Pontibacter sp. G13]
MRIFYRWIGLWVLAMCAMLPLQAQVDTTLTTTPDSVEAVVLDSVTTLGMVIQTSDSAGWLKRVSQNIQSELPEVVRQGDSAKLVIHIPWRDDVQMRWPVGFLKAGRRPPFNPSVAWQRSLVIPGWGQAYNKSYWKLPIVYAGYVGFGYYIGYNQQEYLRYKQNFLCAVGSGADGCTIDADLDQFDAQGLRTRRDQFKRDRNFGIILLAGWHILQVVDAYVDAHLKSFDVSEDLSLQVSPLEPVSAGAMGFGPALRVRW